MHRFALVISTAAAFAPAPRITRPLSRVGAPVPVATARAQPALAAKLPGAEFDGCVAVQGSWLAVCRALRRNYLQRATRHRRDVGPVGLTGLLRTDYGYMWLSASLPSDASENQKTWATRCFLNMHEQAPAFLAAFWTHAIFASRRARPNAARSTSPRAYGHGARIKSFSRCSPRPTGRSPHRSSTACNAST